MRILILLSLFITLFFEEATKFNITIVLSIGWLLYTIFYYFNLKSIKDEKIVTDKCSSNLPNSNKSYFIRYLYSTRPDYKVFFSTIIELIKSNSISLIRNNDTYYFIDNKVKDEKLNKSESYVKKILFYDMGNACDRVSLDTIKNVCNSNSGYISSVFKEWQNIFIYESASLKYFKSVKSIVDNSLFYFVVSMIIALFNVFFTKFLLIGLVIFIVTTLLIKSVNDYSNRESDATKEYIGWLEFKNFISKKEINCNTSKLEQYALYAYVLDEYNSFKEVLNNMYAKNMKCFDESEILYIINLSIFDVVEKSIKDSLNSASFKSDVLFARNKGKGAV